MTAKECTLILAENTCLETKRLLLRPITMADAADMYEYASDEETTAYVFPRHQSLAETKEVIANYFMAAPLGKYAIEAKSNGKMLGTIDLRVESEFLRGELGYTLNKAYWGQGLMPEAALVLLSLGFDKLQLLRIQAFHNLENPKSGRVMEKIGMKKEVELPLSRLWKGQPVGEVMYGITREDWLKHVL